MLYAEPAAADSLGDGAMGAAVSFVDAADPARAGVLHVGVSREVAQALASNMLGVAHTGDDAFGVATRRDAVGELANVICGNVLPAVGGSASVFHLAAPRAVPAATVATGPTTSDVGGSTSIEWLAVEGGRACVTLAWRAHG